jgi:DNA polymerase III subunit alpha
MNLTPSSFDCIFSQLNFPMHGVRLPALDIGVEEKKKLNLKEDASSYEVLRALCLAGFKRLNLSKNSDLYNKYAERVKQELETLKELEFVDYILLVWMVINFCKQNDIPTGAGRGSAAGSLVLFLIGVTAIDPIRHGLYFERFISKTRAKKQIVDGVVYLDGSLMCDIDMDICFYNRPRVIEWLEQKFPGKTSKIITLNCLTGKLLIKECGKIVGGKTEEEMNHVSEMIPKIFGKVHEIDKAYAEVPEFKEWCDQNQEVYQIALKLRNLIKNKGIHASGILISHAPIEETMPTELSSHKEVVCGFDMSWSTLLNLKLDILGLRNVSTIADVCKQVGIKPEDIDVNDSIVYQNLVEAKAFQGLFQIEGDTALKATQKIKPKNIEELSGVMAIGRPGAMAYIDKYAAYTTLGTYEPIHPFFDDILKETGGVCLYQEQMMRMAIKVGFTAEEAETLRRIVGKKKVEEMVAWEAKVKQKIQENNLPVEVGDILWKLLDASKDYSFNKSHSISYATLCAQTIYLKYKYPQQFFLSLLNMSQNEPDPLEQITRIQQELSLFGIKLLPPHILKSKMEFSIEGNDIRYGLLAIKGISDKAIEKLNSFRNEYANKFAVFQGAEEAGLSIGVLSALIQAGALEGTFKQSRSFVVLECQTWNLLKDKEKEMCFHFGPEFDYNLLAVIKHLKTVNNEKGKPILKESRYGTIKKHYAKYEAIYTQNSKAENLACYFYEKKLLGYSHSQTLQSIYNGPCEDLFSIQDVLKKDDNEYVHFVGEVTKAYDAVSKNKNKYRRLTVRDQTGSIEVMLFTKKLEAHKDENGRVVDVDDIVVVDGIKKGEDRVFADTIGIQSQKIYTRLSQLGKNKEVPTEENKPQELTEVNK